MNARAVAEQGVLALAVALRELFPAAWTAQRGHAGGAHVYRTPAGGARTRPGYSGGVRARHGLVGCVPGGRCDT